MPVFPKTILLTGSPFTKRSGSVTRPSLPATLADRGIVPFLCALGVLGVIVGSAGAPVPFSSPATAASTAAVQSPLAARSLLLDGALAGQRLVVVGDRGHILTSDDDGRTWHLAQVPTRVTLTAVHMHDHNRGWAVGHDATILGSSDGGATWQLLYQAPEEELPLLDVWFRDHLTGFAVGAYGYYLVTEDGGTNWSQQTVDVDADFHLNRITAAPDGDRLYIAAEAGEFYRSEGGSLWDVLSTPYGGSWFGALALDQDRLLVAGLRGHLYRSEDAGESWTQVPTGTGVTLTDIVRLPSGEVMVTGMDGVFLLSRDGGRSVSAHQLPERHGIASALATAGGDVLLIGTFGVRPLDRTNPE